MLNNKKIYLDTLIHDYKFALFADFDLRSILTMAEQQVEQNINTRQISQRIAKKLASTRLLLVYEYSTTTIRTKPIAKWDWSVS